MLAVAIKKELKPGVEHMPISPGLRRLRQKTAKNLGPVWAI